MPSCAPHGGGIEPGTSEIARAIAEEDFDLYLFEGILPDHNYTRLHVTSHNFDEPRCLEIISICDIVLAIHGCDDSYSQVLLGGRDANLKAAIARALELASIDCLLEGHPFQGRGLQNICNRGRSGRGVQIELPRKLRRSSLVPSLVASIRRVLLQRVLCP